MKQPVCGSGRKDVGCGQELHWENYPGDPGTDSNIAIRCLDCGIVLCRFCARQHFKSRDEKDKRIAELEAEIRGLCRRRNEHSMRREWESFPDGSMRRDQHDWLVTWRHPSGSIKEPEDVVCTQCGLHGMRWGSYVIKFSDAIDALFRRIKAEDVPRVKPECAGGGNAG